MGRVREARRAVMGFVFTACDNAAREVCAVWPGQPVTAHWGIPDPGNTRGSPEDIERALRDAYFVLERRIELFLSLPHGSLSTPDVKNACEGIGRK